jgi:2,3-bisphosphoglycerate-independent phosphoglycerate mutase
MKKIIFLVIDGLPDEPVPQLGNKTPLEAARRKNLDRLAQNALCGFFKPLFLGKLPDSEEVHLALFGYDPRINFPGRGALEALGLGMKILPTDIVLRGNLATIDGQDRVLDRRAGRIEDKQARKIVKSLDGRTIRGVKFIVKSIYDHRLVIIMRGKGLSEKISETDDKKIKRVKRVEVLNGGKKSKFTALALNEFINEAKDILANHPINQKRVKEGKPPANFILVRSPGKLKRVPNFEKRWGLMAACVSLGNLYQGVARFLGMSIIKERGGNPFSSEYIRQKFAATKRALGTFDFIFCHIKGADILAEDGDFLGKKRFIETIDRNLPILENLKDTLLVVTSDHATSCLQKTHAIFPIPILIYPTTIKPEGYQRFTERDCRKGNLGEIKNLKILPLILRLASEN